MASREGWRTCLYKLLSNHLERGEQNFERCDSMRGWKLESHPVGVPVTSKLVYTCPCRQANLPGWCIGWRKGVRSSMRDELRTSTCAPRKLVSSLFLPLFFFFLPLPRPIPFLEQLDFYPLACSVCGEITSRRNHGNHRMGAESVGMRTLIRRTSRSKWLNSSFWNFWYFTVKAVAIDDAYLT